MESNPLNGVKNFPKTETEIDESSIFTPEEISALLKVADPDLIPTIVIGALAGLRDSEIAKLNWSLVNLEKREIEVKKGKSKTQQRRFVAISDNLLEWLKIYKKDSGPVAPVSRAPGYVGKFSRKRAFELRKAARIASGIGEWVDNGLRHSFCSYHYEQYKDAGLTAHQAGHQNPATTFADYRDLVTKEAAARYWAIFPPDGDSKIIPLTAVA